MPFRASKCIGLTTPNPNDAAKYYQEIFKMKVVGYEDGIHINGGGLHFFIDPGKEKTPIIELIHENNDEARKTLRRFGFDEISWNYPDSPNLVVDPFGITWNVFIEEDSEPSIAFGGCQKPILSKIGIQTPHPEKAARYYAELLSTTASQVHNSWIVDCLEIRFKFTNNLPIGPTFYLDSGFDLTKVDPGANAEDATAIDQFGVRWKLGPAQLSDSAVIQTMD